MQIFLTVLFLRRTDTLCALLGPGVALSNGKISYSCRYNTKRFNSKTDHTVYFKVPCDVGTKSFSVAQHGECSFKYMYRQIFLCGKALCNWLCVFTGKVLSPVDLTEKRSSNGGHVLSWRSPYPASANITRTLTYQLQYSMDGQDWTVSMHRHTST